MTVSQPSTYQWSTTQSFCGLPFAPGCILGYWVIYSEALSSLFYARVFDNSYLANSYNVYSYTKRRVVKRKMCQVWTLLRRGSCRLVRNGPETNLHDYVCVSLDVAHAFLLPSPRQSTFPARPSRAARTKQVWCVQSCLLGLFDRTYSHDLMAVFIE